MSLDALKAHLFETLEGVKNLSDPEASDNEKISLEQAKSIVDISGKIIDIYKVQVEGISTVKELVSVRDMSRVVSQIGIADGDTVRLLEEQ